MFEFEAELWRWNADNAWHFLTGIDAGDRVRVRLELIDG